MFPEKFDLFVVVKFNVQLFKGNINDDVDLYWSYVLENGKNKLVWPTFTFSSIHYTR